MSTYVDGFVIPIPKNKVTAYKKMAKLGCKTWMKHGALSYYECRANDLTQHKMGNEATRAFNEMVGAKDGEDVWFSFIVFKSKEHRDEVNAKVMAEMGEMDMPPADSMPADMTRMAYGGFSVEVEG